jgi:hypothetical protein
VVAGEAHDLAPPGARRGAERRRVHQLHRLGRVQREGREAVLEDDDLVVVGRYLGVLAVAGRAERAQVGRRLVGAVLAMGGDADVIAEERVPPDLGAAGRSLRRSTALRSAGLRSKYRISRPSARLVRKIVVMPVPGR